MTLFISARRLMAATAVFILPVSAHALDGKDLLAKINAAYGADNVALSVASIDVKGDDMTFHAARITPLKPAPEPAQPAPGQPAPPPPAPQATSLSLGDIELKGVTANDDGSYDIDRVEFQPLDMQTQKDSIKASDLYLEGVTIPGKTSGKDLSSLMICEKAHSGPVTVTENGKVVFAIASADSNTSIEDDGASLDFDAAVKGLKLDMTTVPDPKQRDMLEKLNLVHLDGDMTMQGNWELQSGTLDLDSLDFDFANVGKLSVAFSFSGYTLDLMRQLQETARTMQVTAADKQANQAASLAMFGLLQQLSFEDADIRFEDHGLTNRALAYSASERNIAPKDMAQIVKAMVPLMLAQAKLGDLQNSVSAAVNTFIDNPKSLEIAAEPENPVPLPLIIGAAMGAPSSLPKVLGVKVTANQ
ncbi:hypothetical protein NAC44_07125 [Allorhizobium sp. BGMRC 0089]|uniref:hypothetical protein n=1 Tax=Allorhizobium sonneratiae TaxID=2934936 RepID=UPI00203377AB|nr:hypothetical protein [Allorhizobium sonneratiae]MCM2292103.1 hypothetical protein [Allorhizobium sonneratiae]